MAASKLNKKVVSQKTVNNSSPKNTKKIVEAKITVATAKKVIAPKATKAVTVAKASKKSSPKVEVKKNIKTVTAKKTDWSKKLFSLPVLNSLKSSSLPNKNVQNLKDLPKQLGQKVFGQKKIWIPMVVVILLVLASYLFLKYGIVAWIDNKPLTRLELYQTLDQKYGHDIREQLIVEKLINSEANKRGISVTDAEIAQETKKIQDEQGGADSLNQLLQLNNVSQDEFKKYVKNQLIADKIFGSTIQITDDDVTTYKTDNATSLPVVPTGDASAEATQNQQIRDRIKEQKISEQLNSLLSELLTSQRVRRVN